MTNLTRKPSPTTAVVPATPSHTNIVAPDTTRHDGWTHERMIGFLEALVETASVSIAAQTVGMTRQTAYRLRARLMGQPFDHAWAAALEFGLQQLHHEALDRAMNGVPVPIFFAGEQVGERRHFNETLTRFLLDNPNARPADRDTHVRMAALTIRDTMMQRIRNGPVTWTLAEIKKAEALADDILDETDVDDMPKKRRKSWKSKDDLTLSNKDYQRLAQKLGWPS